MTKPKEPNDRLEIPEEAFVEIYTQASGDVADKFYPKGDKRRGQYLRDQGVLCARLLEKMKEMGWVTGEPSTS